MRKLKIQLNAKVHEREHTEERKGKNLSSFKQLRQLRKHQKEFIFEEARMGQLNNLFK
jgi:hypothetical protein